MGVVHRSLTLRPQDRSPIEHDDPPRPYQPPWRCRAVPLLRLRPVPAALMTVLLGPEKVGPTDTSHKMMGLLSGYAGCRPIPRSGWQRATEATPLHRELPRVAARPGQ